MHNAVPSFKRILVATNGSESSRAAVERGLELAAAEGAEVLFLHVRPATVWRYGRLAPASAIPRRLGTPAQDEALTEAAARAEELGVRARLELLSGDAAREIVTVSNLVEADLIVVGQCGRNPLRERVTPTVLRRSKRAVLVAHRGARAAARRRELATAA